MALQGLKGNNLLLIYRLISIFTGCSFHYYYCMFHMSDVWIACWCYSAVTSFRCLLLAPRRIWPVTRVCIYSIPTEQHIRGIKNVRKIHCALKCSSFKAKGQEEKMKNQFKCRENKLKTLHDSSGLSRAGDVYWEEWLQHQV